MYAETRARRPRDARSCPGDARPSEPSLPSTATPPLAGREPLTRALFSRAALCARPNQIDARGNYLPNISSKRENGRARGACANSQTDPTYEKNVPRSGLDIYFGRAKSSGGILARRVLAVRGAVPSGSGRVTGRSTEALCVTRLGSRSRDCPSPFRPVDHTLPREASRAADPSREGRSCSLPSRRPRASL